VNGYTTPNAVTPSVTCTANRFPFCLGCSVEQIKALIFWKISNFIIFLETYLTIFTKFRGTISKNILLDKSFSSWHVFSRCWPIEARKVKQRNKFSDFRTIFLILQGRLYPEVEFYGWKNRKNIYLTDIKARECFS